MTEAKWEQGRPTAAGMMRGRRVQKVRYQMVCSQVLDDTPESYCTYGLECLGDCEGTWVQMDLIEDVSLSRECVLTMASRFNHLALSPLHFRDAVLDSLNS